MKLEFGILGPIEVRADGELIRLGGSKQRALLAILLLHPNHVLSNERLVELLWGDEAPDSVLNALQVHISQLRRVLEPERSPRGSNGLLVHRPSGYMLAVDPDQCDMYQFEQLVLVGRRALASGEADVASRVLRRGLGLWRGSALADFGSELFAVAARKRLEESRLSALEDRIQADMALGQHASLIGELQVLVEAHPLRERLCGELMMSLYRCGRQAEATELYHRTRRRLVDTLGLEPGPDLQRLLSRVLEQDPALELRTTSAPPARTRAHNLPLQLTTFIGRREDLDELKAILAEFRLLTLVGPGGIGKTRLALRLASQLQDSYPDGIQLLDLALVTSPDLLPRFVMSALSIEDDGATLPLEAIGRRLSRQHMLLVVDNCEHVADAAAELLLGILERAPAVTVLATSRERLNVPGERVWRVDPLSTPPDEVEPPLNSLMQFEAVQLFVDRARACDREFALTSVNGGAVAQLCRRLDGLPLALELAAASASVTTPQDMLAISDERSWLPARPVRATHPRQRTLQAALDWSYELLGPHEQLLFRRLSVFAGQFSLHAVDQVCADDRLPKSQLLLLLSALADKSLVAVHETLDGTARYRLLNTIQHYAWARLAETDEADDVLRRHAAYILWLGTASADAIHGADANAWMNHMQEAHTQNDLGSALRWSREADPPLFVRLATASALFWEDRGYVMEGRRWLAAALDLLSPATALRCAALYADGRLALLQPDYVSARRQFEAGLADARSMSNDFQQIRMMHLLGLVAALMLDGPLSLHWLHASLDLAERVADEEALASTLHHLGQSASLLGDDVAAQQYHARSLEIARRLHNHRVAALAHLNLGTIALRRGELDSSAAHLARSLEIWSWLGATVQASCAVAGLGFVAAARGDVARGLRLLAATVAFGEQTGVNIDRTAPLWFAADIPQRLEHVRASAPPEVAAEVWQQGLRLGIEEAIEQALAVQAVAHA